MLIDGISLSEGSKITNLTVNSGAAFPGQADLGEMFYKTSATAGLYYYNGTAWTIIADSSAFTPIAHATDETLHLTSAQNTWLDSVSASAAEVNYLSGVTSAVQTQLNTGAGNLTTHASDETKHLTSGQNTWIDAITATSAEVNYVVGVTSAVQTQIDSKLSKSGGTMTGSIVIPTAQKITLTDQPSTSTDAANKAYVDSLVVGGTTWRNSIVDPSLIAVVSAVPGSPTAGATYIAYGGSYPQNWGTGAAAVVSGDVVARAKASATWIVLKNIAVGDRFIIAGENGTISAALTSAGFYSDDVVQYVSGNPGLTASWTFPEGRGQGGAPEVTTGTTVLCSTETSENYGHAYLYNATLNAWVEVAGPGSVGDGVGLTYSGNVLNVNLGAGVVALPSDEVGIDLYSTAGLFLTVDGTTNSTASAAQLAVKLDGSTLSRSANGVKISTGGVTATELNTTGVGAASYGSITAIPSFTVSADGRLTAASTTPAPYDLAFSTYGVNTASEVVARIRAVRAFTIPSNFTGSIVKAGTAATGSSVFVVAKNGSQVATITFAASGTIATFSTQAAISFAIDDKLTVTAPGTADATLADIDFSILATLA